MQNGLKGGIRLHRGWVLGLGAAIFAGVTAAAATSGAAIAAVDAIVEVISPTPPPALPPAPRLPSGSPFPDRPVFRPTPADEGRLDPAPPKPPVALIEPIKLPAPYIEGPLPERPRAGRENPTTCSAQCSLVINDGLRGCDGNVNLEELARAGRPAPSPTCRRDLVQAYEACMTGCGIELPVVPKALAAGPRP